MENMRVAVFARIACTTLKELTAINANHASIVRTESIGMRQTFVSRAIVIIFIVREIAKKKLVDVSVVSNFRRPIVMPVQKVILVIRIVDHANAFQTELSEIIAKPQMENVHAKPILMVIFVRNAHLVSSIFLNVNVSLRKNLFNKTEN